MKGFVRALIIVAVVVAVGGAIYLRSLSGKAPASTSLATGTVERGSLQATVNAAGNIQAHRTADLSFGQSGVVKKINVKVGDRVKAGDVLGELDTADLDLQLRSAQVGMKNAQDQLAKTRNPNTEQDIANARAQLEAAQASYDKTMAGPTDAELATAQAQYASARAAYDAAVKSAGANTSLTSAAASYEKARIALQDAQAAYDKIAWRGDAAASSQAQTLQSATIDYTSAKAAYDAAVTTADSDAKSKLASATASLQSAQASLDSVKNKVTDADRASAQASLTQAKNSLATLLAGPDANSLDIAQNGVESAQISLDQAKLKMQQARVVAPFDGVVTAVSAKLGQTSSGTAFSMADLDHLEIVVNMAEVDVNKIQVGQQAEVTLDAVPDATFQGAVSLIAPAGVQSSGVVNYPVTIALTRTAETVRTGMTANLNIVIDQRTNALIVPNRAIRTVNRQKVATVLFEGQQIQVPVQTGLSNDTSTEIISGLKEGDAVLLTSTTTSTSNNSFRGGGEMRIIQGGPPPGM